MFYRVVEKIFGDCEKGVSWLNPPLKEKAHCMKQIDKANRYTLFIRDMLKAEGIRDCNFKYWSREEFESSGYVRANLTTKRGCYVKGHTGIMSVLRKQEVLFSFNK